MTEAGGGKTAIVTGATGFVGRYLVDALIDRGYRVVAVTRDADAFGDRPEVRVVACSFDAYDELADRIGPGTYDTFFHLAWGGFAGAQIADPAIHLPSVDAALKAGRAAVDLGVGTFVFMGSISQYEVNPSFATTCDPRGTLVYASAKMCADMTLKRQITAAGTRYCSVLPAMIYGSGARAKALPTIVMAQLLQGQTPQLIGRDHLYDLVYVGDVARACIAVAEKGISGTDYYVGGGVRTFGELFDKVRDVVAPGACLDYGAYPDTSLVDYAAIDDSRLKRDTGFVCDASFETTIQDAAAWVRSNPQLLA